jgi:N-acyl-D-amino-acid deacylase
MDAKGLVIAPGFFDMHNHSDSVILTDGDARSMIRMGVTSMILGEGSSAAPTARFPLFTDYWAALLKGGVSTKSDRMSAPASSFTTAHGQKEGPATPGEVDKMRRS